MDGMAQEKGGVKGGGVIRLMKEGRRENIRLMKKGRRENIPLENGEKEEYLTLTFKWFCAIIRMSFGR